MKKVSVYMAVLGLAAMMGSCCCGSKKADAQQLFMGDDIAVANTKYGQVKGYILRDVYTFLGVPYGAPTSGENRFMAPKEPEPWEDIRPTVFYGPDAPQNMENKWGDGTGYYSFSDHWNYFDVNENCLNLNVWTMGLGDGAKRPVMVWLHGGGYTAGNSVEQDGYVGENFSRYGNVVFVSLNHRLGAMGFSDFSGVDSKYADSGNVGMLDIVAALKWIHENIANFGGDPGNVTIMGQSGGGGKVCNLVAMPETKGLVHKAVALSGNTTGAGSREASQALGKYMVEQAGSIEALQAMDWKDYMAFANKCMQDFNRQGGPRASFSPVADGIHIPTGVFYSDKSAPSNDIPMIFCTTTCENSASRTDAKLEEITRDEVIQRITQSRRVDAAKAEQIYDAYNGIFPGLKPIDILGFANSPRTGVIRSADAKCVQDAPVYLAWFGWNPPLFDGRMRAFHCLDICFWYMNTDLMLTHTGGGKRPRELSKKMADALLSFMRTGTPSAKGMPDWPEYTPENGATMYLNDKCQVLMAPDRPALELMK